MKVYRDVRDLIGDTPLFEISGFALPEGVRVFAKLEMFNPGGSVKDRVGLSMLEAAEKSGRLQPGGTVIEPTAGNTGIGIALAAVGRGYRVIFVVPEHFSAEKQSLMRALGAEIVHTPRADGMAGAIAKARELEGELAGAFMPQQFVNQANPLAHYQTTGPEIWRHLDGRVDVLVAGVGTGGTFTGTARFLKEKNPGLIAAAVEPEGSVLKGGVAGSHRTEGIGVEFIPETLDTALIDRVWTVADDEAFRMVRELARRHGLLVGSSSGAAFWAALREAERAPAGRETNIAVIFPDSSERYLSKHIYDEPDDEPDDEPGEASRGAREAGLAPAGANGRPRLRTRLIHGGGAAAGPDAATGAVSVPIYQVSTYRQDAPGRHHGYEYSRTKNPTRQAVEDLIADLEGGAAGFAFASGMAALSTVLMLFEAGDHVIVGDDVYGGTFRVLDKVFRRFGLRASFVDVSDQAILETALTPETKAVFLETPSNPLLKVTDLAAAAETAHARGALVVVDNTFMTPYRQRPLELGADIVVHSATKYLGGHSDLVAGLAVVANAELGERLHFLQNAVGAVLDPFDAWLVVRGIRTLGVRLDAHEQNAQAVAEWLAGHSRVVKVYYPGLSSHPGHEVTRRQATGFGGMVSFDVGDAALAEDVATRVRVWTLAESLGAVESLISLPAKMTHASIPPVRRAELGITDSLIRLSVGIEDVGDLIADLEQALR